MNKAPVTIVVITKNEEKNIETCLQSVSGWAGEIIVVDDESKDRTVALAEKFADKIFHRKMDNEGIHRNWAYAQAGQEWVLSLDADEILTEELKEEISVKLPSSSAVAYTIPQRLYIGDYWIKHGGQYPAAKVRLFRKNKCQYEEVGVHPRLFTEGGNKYVEHLTKDMIHKGYKNFEHYLTKLNNLTTLEARKWFETKRNMTFGKAMWRTLDRFPRAYIFKKGYKDGFIGFMVAFFASLYQIVSYAKYWELKRQ